MVSRNIIICCHVFCSTPLNMLMIETTYISFSFVLAFKTTLFWKVLWHRGGCS